MKEMVDRIRIRVRSIYAELRSWCAWRAIERRCAKDKKKSLVTIGPDLERFIVQMSLRIAELHNEKLDLLLKELRQEAERSSAYLKAELHLSEDDAKIIGRKLINLEKFDFDYGDQCVHEFNEEMIMLDLDHDIEVEVRRRLYVRFKAFIDIAF